jgi:hypothetical protein
VSRVDEPPDEYEIQKKIRALRVFRSELAGSPLQLFLLFNGVFNSSVVSPLQGLTSSLS